MEEVTLEFLDKLDYLHLATSLSRNVCKTLKNHRLEKGFFGSVELAVSEACTNAIKYAYSAESAKKIILSFQIYQDRLVIKVKDQGRGFDIEQIPPPDFESHPEGGYGIYLIKSKMDQVEYKRENELNVLSMTKYYRAKKTNPWGGKAATKSSNQ